MSRISLGQCWQSILQYSCCSFGRYPVPGTARAFHNYLRSINKNRRELHACVARYRRSRSSSINDTLHDDDTIKLTDAEVESMLQTSKLPLFWPTTEVGPASKNSLNVVLNLWSLYAFSKIHRNAFDANNFIEGVKIALPAYGQAIRDHDLDRIEEIATPKIANNVKLTLEMMNSVDFVYDIQRVTDVHLDRVSVENIWSRLSPLTIDVVVGVSETFSVKRREDGVLLHPRMSYPFDCVRRYRFSSTSGDEDARTWYLQEVLGLL
eukprot:gene6295-7460_t